MNNRDYQIMKKILKEITIALEMFQGISQTDFLRDEKL
jgi:hypothetical protein